MTAPATTIDAFLGGKLMIEQPKSGYRAGIDAVLLAATVVPTHKPVRILDAGAGVGTVGLCVASRCARAFVVLLEREPELAALARANAVRNGLTDRVSVVEADIATDAAALAAAGLGADSVDHVLANPPYHDARSGTLAPDALKASSHAMPHGELDLWGRVLARMARTGGTATIVHKADALPAILTVFAGRFGALRVLPLHPRAGAPANRIIAAGTKGSRAPLTLQAGWVLHETEGNAFTPQTAAILRNGAALDMAAPIIER